jgi:manganese/iron transport system substrate-binding protein
LNYLKVREMMKTSSAPFKLSCAVAYMRSGLFMAAIGFIGLGIGGCDAPEAASADEPPNVVATSTILSDWTDQIGGEQINLTGILNPGDDPHVYEPTPRDTRTFEEADLIFYNGYDLEPGLIRLMDAAGANAVKVAIAEVVTPLQLEEEGQTVPDPHVWGSAENAIVMVEAIRDGLVELLPDEQAEFDQNADRLIAELEQLHTWIQQQTATIPPDQRQLVTTHDAFQYYARAYGLTVPGTLIGISTEEQPSAQTVQQLVDRLRELQVPAIFAETTINPQLISTVAEEAGVQLAEAELYSDSIGAPGSDADSYVKMMEANTRTIVENLGGTYTPFDSPES